MFVITLKITAHLTLQPLDGSRHDLVENMVRTLQRLLGNDTSLLQQVCKRQSSNCGTVQIVLLIKNRNKTEKPCVILPIIGSNIACFIKKAVLDEYIRKLRVPTYRSQYQHQQVFQMDQSEYG